MDEKELQRLYNAVNSKFDIGDYNTFRTRMQTPEDRKKFYDVVGSKGFDLGEYPFYEERLSGVKKKPVSEDGFTGSANGVSSNQDIENEPLPSQVGEYQQGEVDPPDVFELTKQYNDLSKAEKVNYRYEPQTGATVSDVTPDQEKRDQAKGIKQSLMDLGIDNPETFYNEIKDLTPTEFGTKGFSKQELIADRKDNYNHYLRKIGTIKWRRGLESELADRLTYNLNEGGITKEAYDNVLGSIQSSLKSLRENVGDYRQQRDNARNISFQIKQFGGQKKDELLANYAADISKLYGNAYKKGFEKYAASAPESKYLDNNALLAYEYLQDVSPEKAKQYELLLRDPKTLKDDPDALSAYNRLMLNLKETGIGLQKNAINEDLNSLVKVSKENDGLTPEQLQEVEKLQERLHTIETFENTLDSEYPERIEDEVDDAVQEIMGQKTGYASYVPLKAKNAVKNTVKGVWEMVSEPFLSDESNQMRELSIMGESVQDEKDTHKVDKNVSLQTSKMVFDPQLKSKLDAVNDDNSLTYGEKEDKIQSILRSNRDKFGRVEIAGGKMNVSPASIAYGVTDLATTLLPFFAVEAATGGIGGAGTAAKFFRTANAALLTGFHDHYAESLNKGLRGSNAYFHAMGMTSIDAAIMAGAGTVEAVKAFYKGKNLSSSKVIEKLSDKEIQAGIDRGLSKGLKSVKQSIVDRAKATPGMIAKGAKTGAEFEVAMAAGEQLKGALNNERIDPKEQTKRAVLGIINFAGMASVLGHAGYKSPNDLQRSYMVDIGKQPDGYKAALEKMRKDGDINKEAYEEKLSIIDRATEAYKTLPKYNSKGKPITEAQKGDYIMQTVAKNEHDVNKKNLPPKQAADAELKSKTADYVRQMILDEPTDKQLETQLSKVEKSLEPKKNADGKIEEMPENERLELKAEKDAIEFIINERKEKGEPLIPKGEPEQISQPIELSTEVGELKPGEPAKQEAKPTVSKDKKADIERRKQALRDIMEATGEWMFINGVTDGTFMGDGLLNMNENGDVVLTRFTDSQENLTKGKGVTENLANIAGQFGGEQVATSGIEGGLQAFSNGVVGEYHIPLSELIQLIKDGYIVFAGLGNKEFVLSPHIADKYLTKINGKLINAKYDAELKTLEEASTTQSELEAKNAKEKGTTEVTPTSTNQSESNPALKDVESTAKQELDADKLNKEAGVDIYVARQEVESGGNKYYLSQIKENNSTNTFLIEDANGNEIGKAQLSKDGNFLENIRIDEKHRRKGLASKVYDFIELRKGIELEPSPNKQSKEAKALWDKRNLQKSVSNKANGGLLAKALGESMSKAFSDFRKKQEVLLELENRYFKQKGLSREDFNKLSESDKADVIKDAVKWKNENPELVKAVESLLSKEQPTIESKNLSTKSEEITPQKAIEVDRNVYRKSDGTEYTKEEKEYVNKNIIIKSGIASPRDWETKDGVIKVERININTEDIPFVYKVTKNNERVLTTTNYEEALQYTTDYLLSKEQPTSTTQSESNPALSDVASADKKTNTVNGYEFTKTPTLDNVIVEPIEKSNNAIIEKRMFADENKNVLADGVKYIGGGWYEIGRDNFGSVDLYNTVTKEGVSLNHKQGGRMGVVIQDFIKNNSRYNDDIAVRGSKYTQEEHNPKFGGSGHYKGTYFYVGLSAESKALEHGKNLTKVDIGKANLYELGEDGQTSQSLKKEAKKAGYDTRDASGYAESEYLKKQGYDGIKRGNEIVLFEPKKFEVKEEIADLPNVSGGTVKQSVPEKGATAAFVSKYNDNPLQMARREKYLDSPVMSNGKQTTERKLIEERVKQGWRVTKITTTDTAASKKLNQEYERLKRTAPIGNENHPETKRLRELEKMPKSLYNEREIAVKKEELRLESPEGTTISITPFGEDYVNELLYKSESLLSKEQTTSTTQSEIEAKEATQEEENTEEENEEENTEEENEEENTEEENEEENTEEEKEEEDTTETEETTNEQPTSKEATKVVSGKYNILERGKELVKEEQQSRTSKRANETGVSDSKIATEKKDDSKFQNLASKIVDEALKNNNDDLLATVEDLKEQIEVEEINNLNLDTTTPSFNTLKVKIYGELLARAVALDDEVSKERIMDLYSKTLSSFGSGLGASSNDIMSNIKILDEIDYKVKQEQEVLLNLRTASGKTISDEISDIISGLSKDVSDLINKALNETDSKINKAVNDIVAENEKETEPKKTFIPKDKKGKELIKSAFDELKKLYGGGNKLSFALDPKREAEEQLKVHKKTVQLLVQIGKGLIQEGVATIQNISDKIRDYIGRELGNAINFDDFKNEVLEKLNKQNKEKSIKSSNSEKLAEAIYNHNNKKDKPNKDKDIKEKIAEALILKYKADNKQGKPKSNRDILKEIAERVLNNDIADKLWDEAYIIASNKIDSDINLSEEEKQSQKDDLKEYIAKSKGSPFRDSEVREIVRNKFATDKDALRVKIRELAVSHFDDVNAEADSFVSRLMDETGLSYNQAETLFNAIKNEVKEIVARKAEQSLKAKDKRINDAKNNSKVKAEKPKTKIDNIVNDILRFGNIPQSRQGNYTSVLQHYGIPISNATAIRNLQQLAVIINSTSGVTQQNAQVVFQQILGQLEESPLARSKVFWNTLQNGFLANILGRGSVAIKSLFSTYIAGNWFRLQQSIVDLFSNYNGKVGLTDRVRFAFGNQRINKKVLDKLKNGFTDENGNFVMPSNQSQRSTNVLSRIANLFDVILRGNPQAKVWYEEADGMVEKELGSVFKDWKFSNALKKIYTLSMAMPVMLVRSLGAGDLFVREGVYNAQLSRIKGKEILKSGVKYGSKEYYEKLLVSLVQTEEVQNEITDIINKEEQALNRAGITMSEADKRRRRRELEAEKIGVESEVARIREEESIIAGMVSPMSEGLIKMLMTIQLAEFQKKIEGKRPDEIKASTIAIYNTLRLWNLFAKTLVPIVNIVTKSYIYGLKHVPIVGVGVHFTDKKVAQMIQKENYIEDKSDVSRMFVRQMLGLGMSSMLMSLLFEGADDDEEEDGTLLNLQNKDVIFWGGYDKELAQNYPDKFRPNSLYYKGKLISFRDNPITLLLYPIGQITNSITKRDMYKNNPNSDGTPSDKYLQEREKTKGNGIERYIKSVLWNVPLYFKEMGTMQGIRDVLDILMGDEDWKIERAINKVTTAPFKATPLHSGLYTDIIDMQEEKSDYASSKDFTQNWSNYLVQNSVFQNATKIPDKLDILGNKIYKQYDLSPIVTDFDFMFSYKELPKEMKDVYDYASKNNIYLGGRSIKGYFNYEVKEAMKKEETAKLLKDLYKKTEGNIPNDANFENAVKVLLRNELKVRYGKFLEEYVKNKQYENLPIEMQQENVLSALKDIKDMVWIEKGISTD